MEVNDEESLEKEKVTIEESIKNNNIFIEKLYNLIGKIKTEINKIDQIYNKINKEVTDFFIKQYEKLIKEENDLKEKLQNEVTKAKEKLENYLLAIN